MLPARRRFQFVSAMPIPSGDWGRVFNKTGVGPNTFIDSGLFETDSASWVAAAMASSQPGPVIRPDDPAPTALGQIGHTLYRARSSPPS